MTTVYINGRAFWAAWGGGQVTDDEAERLSERLAKIFNSWSLTDDEGIPVHFDTTRYDEDGGFYELVGGAYRKARYVPSEQQQLRALSGLDSLRIGEGSHA